jgi:hypothetical protein
MVTLPCSSRATKRRLSGDGVDIAAANIRDDDT